MEKDSLCNKWEMQMETTVKYHLTPIKMTTLKKKKKKTESNKCWQECEEIGTLLHYWWDCKMLQLLPITVW